MEFLIIILKINVKKGPKNGKMKPLVYSAACMWLSNLQINFVQLCGYLNLQNMSQLYFNFFTKKK